MAVRAVEPILNGAGPVIPPGDEVPETYPDLNGDLQPRDLDRLIELGVAERVEEKPKPRQRRSSAKRDS